jgi:hypothetical protein
MWLGPAGVLMIAGGVAGTYHWGNWTPVTVSFLILPGIGMVVSASAIAGVEGLKQLQEHK